MYTKLLRAAHLLCHFLCMLAQVVAQAPVDSAGTSRNTIYLSAWGHGGLYSVNYDRAWRVGRNRMSVSIGATYLPDIGPDEPSYPSVPKYSLPVQWNFFHGEGPSTMEHGLGLSLWSGWNAIGPRYVGTVHELGPVSSTALYAFVKPIGYRLQPKRHGFFLRAHVLLALKLAEFDPKWDRYSRDHPNREQKVLLLPGLDLGYSFKVRKR
ncbi:MAG: hypothetical protein KIT10_13405 [Flavobacteriales bacterium]|nr:hypothetical protein [Flavobacteriales bacterium]